MPRVELQTTKGKIVLELFENEAPNTVANFITLVEKGFYDGTAFHRVIPAFMIQGGDPNSRDEDPTNDGIGGPGYTIACECYQANARKHFRGSLSMAHAGRDTGGSQFFITHLPTPHLNADSQRNTGHTVFGRVVSGMDVVDAIEKGDRIVKATVLRKRPHPYRPNTKPAAEQNQ
ncbi:MAG: peptidylprolyl isomerase [Planctomycetota bacterium]|nr:MAG: peptidylprolyl isomerase [Planctomycetota bacterium]